MTNLRNYPKQKTSTNIFEKKKYSPFLNFCFLFIAAEVLTIMPLLVINGKPKRKKGGGRGGFKMTGLEDRKATAKETRIHLQPQPGPTEALSQFTSFFGTIIHHQELPQTSIGFQRLNIDIFAIDFPPFVSSLEAWTVWLASIYILFIPHYISIK